MKGVKCFFLEPTGRYRFSLRRFAWSSPEASHSCNGYAFVREEEHAEPPASVLYETCPATLERYGTPWPTRCNVCARGFRDVGFNNHGEWMKPDPWQTVYQELFRRSDGGPDTTLEAAPPGALWYADWLILKAWKGPDGHILAARCPDGTDWIIDGQASNCTQKDDAEHRCWVRHGTPPLITVDKDGRTCDAGAGSIQTAGYHGHLRDGVFTDG